MVSVKLKYWSLVSHLKQISHWQIGFCWDLRCFFSFDIILTGKCVIDGEKRDFSPDWTEPEKPTDFGWTSSRECKIKTCQCLCVYCLFSVQMLIRGNQWAVNLYVDRKLRSRHHIAQSRHVSVHCTNKIGGWQKKNKVESWGLLPITQFSGSLCKQMAKLLKTHFFTKYNWTKQK